MKCICGFAAADRDAFVDHVVDAHDGFEVVMSVYLEEGSRQ